jgi:branched-chain amino acid transport system substrate-binding protein
MKKIFILAAILSVVISVRVDADDRPVIKIGAIVPLSGDMALHGTEIQRAMHMALDQLQPSKTHYAYTLRFEDNQLDGAKSVSAAHKLIDIDKVDAILTLWPPTANVVLPMTERAGVLQYTIAWDPNLAKDHRFLLSHQAMVDEIARSTLRLLRHEGKRRVAFLHMEETGFNLGASYIKQLASGEGIDLVADEAFNPKEVDFRSLLARVNSKSPDSYVIWAVMPSMDIVIRRIRDMDPKAYITGYLDYAEDLSQVQHTPYISEMFASESFAADYKRKYGSPPVSKGPNAFDITRLLVQAFESSPSKKLTAHELKSYFVQVRDFPGAVGRFSIDQFGNSTYSPVVREARDRERVLVSVNLEENKRLDGSATRERE